MALISPSAHRTDRLTEALLPSTVGSALRDAADSWPEAIGLVATRVVDGEPDRWSFGRLLEDAEHVAGALLGRFEPAERVAVWAPNVAEAFLLQLGAALAGITLVPVPPGLRPRDLQHVLDASGAVGIFLVPRCRGHAMAEILDDARGSVPGLREVVDLTRWDAFLDARSDATCPRVEPRDTALIQYTSGSTGLPKGALLHHLGITNSARFTADRMGVGPGDVWLNCMPLSYVAGNSIGALAALGVGATQVLCDFQPSAVLQLIETQRCTALLAGVTMYKMLLDDPALRSTDVSSLRTVIVGGSTIPAALADQVEEGLGARLCIGYGLTEACGFAVTTAFDDDDGDRTAGIGTPLPHVETAIVDPVDGARLDAGQAGELLLRGYQVIDAFLELPEATPTGINADGWLHTGDLATVDERGHVQITDRLKEIINRGGRKIAPGEIEALLQEHPAVALAAVVGVPDEHWGEEIAAAIQLRPGATTGDAELTAWCRAHLASFKTPRRWAFVEQLPLTSAGKIRKFLVRDQFADPP
jgi:fatty-acyl-CoA synthase